MVSGAPKSIWRMAETHPSSEPTVHYTVDPDWFVTLQGPATFSSSTPFLTDIDGVLVDWGHAFEKWIVEERLGYHPSPDKTIAQVYNLFEWIFPNGDDASKVLARSIIDEFQASEHAARIPAYADALEYLPKIAALGYHFSAISTAGIGPGIPERRLELLNHHFPGLFAAIHILPPVVAKRVALKLYSPTYWVDDHINHVKHARELGHFAFHLEHDKGMYVNEGEPDQNFHTSWKTIYEHLLQTTRLHM